MCQPNKIAIVTGAGSGIGRAVAIALFNDGWSIVLAGRREQQLIETANACDVKRTLVVPTDINIPESVQHLLAKTMKTFGRSSADITSWKKLKNTKKAYYNKCLYKA